MKPEIQSWEVLIEQIKADLNQHAKSPLTLVQINQLLILHILTNLQIKGFSDTEASLEIAMHWHEGKGAPSVYFAQQVWALAQHYQIYEQLSRECRGTAYNAGDHSLLKDEVVRGCATLLRQCKYRYWQAAKRTFEDAKMAAHDALDLCPVNVIRHFINHSRWFMSAYRKGLSEKAAAWVVHKQKGHRVVSEAAMMALKAVLNP
ncbi:hypothetical protein AN958_11797 [Leucoagaricus sp. SymC.cos]|nr:hypothetical protein AN958_11797 [Leucoagaricus sp. SymC.cos]